MPGGETVLKQLERAVSASRVADLAELCSQHRDTILASFDDWRMVPVEIRGRSEALDLYSRTLIAVAQHFEEKLGDPRLMQLLVPADQDDLLQQWREMLEAIDEVKAQGDYEDALEGMAALMEITNAIQGSETSHLFALAYGRYGELYFKIGDIENSRKYNELALGACLDAGDADGVLIYIRNLYEVARGSQDNVEMEKWSAIGIRATSDLGQLGEASEWRLRMAETQDAQGRWPDAARMLDEALGSARTALAGDKPAFSVFLNNAAELLRRHNELQKARPLYEEAIALRRSAGLRDATLARFLHNLAFLHQQSDDIKPAGPLLEESLAIERSVLPADAPLIAETLNNLGVYYHWLGDAARARASYAEALKLRNAQPELDVGEQGIALSNWAELELNIGNDPAAKALLDRLEEALPSGEQDDTERFRRFNRVASLYERLGKYEMAEDLMRQVADFVERVHGKDSPNYARAIASLASVAAHQDRPKEAEELFQDAIKRIRAGTGFQEDDLSSVLNNFGLFYYDLAKNAEAEELLAEALERRRRALPAADPNLLDTLNNLGLVYVAQARYGEAERLLREVLDARRTALIPDHPNIAQSLFNLGMLYGDTDRIAEALPLLKEQFKAEERFLSTVFSVASESERLAYAAKLRETLDVLLMKMINWGDRPDAIRMAFEAALGRKGIVAEAMANERSSVLGEQGSGARKLLEELNTVRSRLARGILDGTTGGAAEHGVELSRLAREREQLEAKLARELAGAEGASRTDFDSMMVAGALPPDSALLEFVKFKLVTTGVTSDETYEAYIVFVLPNGEPEKLTLYQLGLAKTMEPAVELFRAAITQDDETFRRLRNVAVDSVDVAATELGVGSALTEVLVDRVRPALGSRKRLFIAPDGILNRLPFEALPGKDGARIGEEFEISLLSTGRDLLRIHSGTEHKSGPAVVVADPDFDLETAGEAVVSASVAESRSLLFMNRRFQPLPDTKTEGDWVAQRLGVSPWLGSQALEARVKSCQSPRILHLATHGFLRPRNPQRNVNPVSDGADTAAVSPVGKSLDNPLLRSGLALAGANRWLDGHSLPTEAEDGLLMAEDVCAMNLLGTELVVLSACETGLGEYRTGEGVFGLRRAFELAGARSLIMSLWRVPSGPTCELMQHLYRQLSLGRRRSEALREAQRILRRRYPETFYWGAFVLSGDPSPMHV